MEFVELSWQTKEWVGMMAQGYGGAGLLVGFLYGIVQKTRHAKTFFTWACAWRLAVFEIVLLGFFLGFALPLLNTRDARWPELFLAAIFYSVLAIGMHLLAFFLAHKLARWAYNP